jgi:hypothetical protein
MRAMTYPSQHRLPVPGQGVLGPWVTQARAGLGQPEAKPYWSCESFGVMCKTRCVCANKPQGPL